VGVREVIRLPRTTSSASPLGLTPVTIDGTEYYAEITIYSPPTEFVRVENAMMPDPHWRQVDHAGHVHFWAGTDRAWRAETTLPSLRRLSARVRCDGSCNDPGCTGWTRSLYACRVCAAWVTPGFVPDLAARAIGLPITAGPATAELKIRGAWPVARENLRVELLGRTGVGIVDEIGCDFSEESWFTVSVILDDAP
jgi:hypothetical protein